MLCCHVTAPAINRSRGAVLVLYGQMPLSRKKLQLVLCSIASAIGTPESKTQFLFKSSNSAVVTKFTKKKKKITETFLERKNTLFFLSYNLVFIRTLMYL